MITSVKLHFKISNSFGEYSFHITNPTSTFTIPLNSSNNWTRIASGDTLNSEPISYANSTIELPSLVTTFQNIVDGNPPTNAIQLGFVSAGEDESGSIGTLYQEHIDFEVTFTRAARLVDLTIRNDFNGQNYGFGSVGFGINTSATSQNSPVNTSAFEGSTLNLHAYNHTNSLLDGYHWVYNDIEEQNKSEWAVSLDGSISPLSLDRINSKIIDEPMADASSVVVFNRQKRLFNISRADISEYGTTQLGVAATVVDLNSATISAPPSKLVNGKTLQFAAWSDGNSINPRTLTPTGNITLSAIYKGTQLSALSTAFSISNQRKVVRSTNGWNHMVYESMGNVWYEAKPSSGNWGFIPGMNGSLHLNFGAGKTPAIARTASTHPWGDMTLVAWQEANTIVMRIHYYSAASQSYIRAFPTLYTDIVMPSYYTLDVNPSIAWSDNGGFVLVYHSPTGIQYELYDFELGNTPSLISSGVVPGTDANSKNAAVSSYSYSVVDYTWFDIAWEQHGFSNGPIQSIKHSTLYYSDGEIQVSSPQTVSSSSVPKNSGISIVSLESGPMIGWISNATAVVI